MATTTKLNPTTSSVPRKPAATGHLPTTRQAAPVMERLLQERPGRRVSQSELADFYDAVLVELGLNPSTEAYPRVVARLHSILCLECPRVRGAQEKGREPSLVWTRRAIAQTTTAEEE